MAKNQSQLTPEQQAVAFLIAKQQGQQPVSGGMSPDTQDPIAQMGTGQMDAQSAQAMFGGVEQQPGDKMHPAEAMHKIASGMQLGRNQQGQLTRRVPVDQPLLRLFGMKKNQTIDTPNFYDTAKAAGIEKFLPSGLPRTPEGTPFMGPHTFQSALQAAQSFGTKTRASFYQSRGFDLDSGMPVAYDQSNNKWYKGDKEVPASEVTRLLSNTLQNVPEAEANKLSLLNTRLSQIKNFKDTFDPESWGLINGSLNKTIAFYTDKDPKRADQYKNLYDIVADIVHERYGANLTANELDQKVDSIMSKYQSATAINAFVKIQEARSKTEKNNRITALKAGKYLGADALEQGGASAFPTGDEPPAAAPTQPTAKKDPQARYAQLIKSGSSKKQAYAIMHSEGY